MFDIFNNMEKRSLRLCEKSEEYLLGSHLDWREQPDINTSIAEETCRFHRSEARMIIYSLTARTLKFMLYIKFFLLQDVRSLGFSGGGTCI